MSLTFRATLAFIYQLSQTCDIMKTSPVIVTYDMGYARMVLLSMLALSTRPPRGETCPGATHAFRVLITPCRHFTEQHKICQSC